MLAMALVKPVEWWSGWADFLGVTAAILGGILALVALLGWTFSWKAGKLKEEALEKYKVESRESIAKADAKAAEANKAAARANEGAAMELPFSASRRTVA